MNTCEMSDPTTADGKTSPERPHAADKPPASIVVRAVVQDGAVEPPELLDLPPGATLGLPSAPQVALPSSPATRSLPSGPRALALAEPKAPGPPHDS